MANYPMNMNVGAHIPPRLVFDFDIYDAGEPGSDFYANLYNMKKKAPPVFWTRCNEGHWYVTDRKLAEYVHKHPDRFSTKKLTVPDSANAGGGKFVLINMDPPEHTKFRNPMSVALSRKSVAELAPGVRKLAIEIIEELKPKGKCEFMADFAFQLPIIVFLKLVDVPLEHRFDLLKEVAKIIKPGNDKKAVVAKMAQYLAPTIDARYAKPGTDLISWLSQQSIDGQRMPKERLHSLCTLLLIGGLDSVANTMGFFARFLADNPAHRRQIIDNPSIIASAVEELLRRFPTVTAAPGRLCVQDTQLGDAQIKVGEMVMAPSVMMSFDDELYPDPLEVDFTRHISSVGTFGAGAHRCAGANLARSELTIFIEEWLKRIPDFSVSGSVPFQPGINTSYASLPLQW